MRKDNLICRRLLLLTVACMCLIFASTAIRLHIKQERQSKNTLAYAEYLEELKAAVDTEEPTTAPTAEPTEEPLKSLGMFKLTAYCACEYCCGKTDGITASGTKVEEGRTIAADTDILPFGTKVIINGHEYTVEDRGGCVNGNHIDVYMNSHDAAVVFGVQYAEVFVKNE